MLNYQRTMEGPMEIWTSPHIYWAGAIAILIAALGVAVIAILTLEDNKKQKIISLSIAFIVAILGFFGVYANKKAYESGIIKGYVYHDFWYGSQVQDAGEVLARYGYLRDMGHKRLAAQEFQEYMINVWKKPESPRESHTRMKDAKNSQIRRENLIEDARLYQRQQRLEEMGERLASSEQAAKQEEKESSATTPTNNGQ